MRGPAAVLARLGAGQLADRVRATSGLLEDGPDVHLPSTGRSRPRARPAPVVEASGRGQRTAMPAAATGTSPSVPAGVSVPSSPIAKVTMPWVPAAST
jgi:hypothetical protein